MARSLLRTWWWVPLILLFMILFKAWLVAGMVQDRAQRLAADAAGLPLERVEMVDGLDVRLTGFTNVAARDEAVATVAALDSSWDVEGVLVDGAAAAPAPAADATTTTAAAASTTAATPVAAEVDVALTADGVVLDGVVGSDSTRSALVAAAIGRFGADNVEDRLTVDADGLSDDGGVLVATGVAVSEAQRLDWLSGVEELAAPVNCEVDDRTSVGGGVTQELNALFELQPIEFDSSRATIRGPSEPTLDEAVELINANPDVGLLRVIGHTDSDGSAVTNLDLSRRRADAVVAYLVDAGVAPERLEAEGRGETELKVDPDISSEDKQRNRRIEWELGS